MSSVNLVADEIILLHRELFQESISNMKLQKLCYYAEGFHLAQFGQELFPEGFQAWVHGPVCPDLYRRFKEFGWRQIDATITAPTLSEELRAFLRNVVEAYGVFDGAALSRMTHQELPWMEARNGLPEMQNCETAIKKPTMQRYFKQLMAAQAAST